MTSPHAILIPYPAQGHVIPFLELAYCLADRGFEITFVNTEHIHGRVTAALAASKHDTGLINLVSVPDGLESSEERSDLVKLSVRLSEVVPGSVEELIVKINNSGSGSRITSLIADENLSWIMPMAKKMGLHAVAFWPAAAATLSLLLSIPQLIEDGVIDAITGEAKIEEKVQLSAGMPSILPREFAWNAMFCDRKAQEEIIKKLMDINKGLEFADMIICNSFHEIEAPTFNFLPKVLPIGPLLSGQRTGKAVGNFWPEDSSCVSWLDEQKPNSVIYIAFGSFTVFDQLQFAELALGLELTGRPFLWVVRPDLTDQTCNAYPEGFRERVGGRGRIVGWSPQQRVLAHSSIACFVSHCGWNSTMEGMTNGVPFLCWPYFTDQFMNRTYICDVWKNGLEVKYGEDGVVSREEISGKIEKLLGDGEVKAKALALKDMAFEAFSTHGGSSFKNFNTLVEEWCIPGKTTTLTATNFCPPNWSKPSDAGGWCNPPRKHFDMAMAAFLKIVKGIKVGIVPVRYRRVQCVKKGGIRFEIKGNPNWNMVLVYNVGGAGDVKGVEVKGEKSTGWIGMSRNWGQNWQTGVQLIGQSLSFRVTVSDGRTVEAGGVVPANWGFGQTFESKVQF
ncbi:hypothetical protein J5N97_008441 [Dioscorea zingiberensis]|uniref:UDP-glycosyltransferase n=1 Tax=Dioscorea zingiberensis TaxID=325984 RepID=A0A9D5CV89_9LILI|nr:hypothetical protein J5N97_008441 [Dioscorea zingiberensis]